MRHSSLVELCWKDLLAKDSLLRDEPDTEKPSVARMVRAVEGEVPTSQVFEMMSPPRGKKAKTRLLLDVG